MNHILKALHACLEATNNAATSQADDELAANSGTVTPQIVIDLDDGLLNGPLSLQEVRSGFYGLEHEFPPLMSLETAATLSGLSRETLKKQVSEGLFETSVRRGKPLRFWRDRFVIELFKTRERRAPRSKARRTTRVSTTVRKEVTL